MDWEACCQMGSVAAVYAVERHGTQAHRMSREDFRARYEKHFGSLD